MGRGKKKYTCPVIRSSRSLPKSQLGAVIFGCKHHTFSECLNRKIFGLPDAHYSYVRNIDPGLVLFLFNYNDRSLHGIFKAASRGQLNLDNQAWASCEGVDYSPYAAQVQMDIQKKCRPLFEDEFKPIIKNNYYSENEKLFWFELDKKQTHELIQLFLSKPLPEQMPRPPKRENTFRPLKTENMPRPPKQINMFDALSNSDADVADPDDEFENLEKQSNSGGADIKLKDSKVSYAPVLNSTHSNKKWSDFFGASSSSHQETSKPTFRDWPVEVESNLLQETSGPPSGDWTVDVVGEPHVFDSWEEHALEEDGLPQELYENEEPNEQFHELESEGLELTSFPLPSLENLKFSDRESSELETSDSNIQSDFTDSAIQRNHKDSQSGLIKVTLEIESLKLNQLKQRLKMDSLEQELVQSKIEIEQLKKRCYILESLPSSARNQSNAEVCDTSDERVLIVGGFDGHSWLRDLSSYSPLKGDVISLRPMTFRRVYPSVTKLYCELYVMGGFDEDVWYDTVESYNPMTDEWIQRPSISKKKGSMASTSLNETIFIMGGENGVETLSEVELFNLNIGSWIPTQSMLEKRTSAAAACMNGAIYVAGGFYRNAYLSSVERFDPRQGGWSRVSSMNSKRGYHSLVALNEKLYALGGYGGNSEVSTVEVFDPRLGSWMMKEPMTVPRLNFGSFVFKDKIYTIGGAQGVQVLDVIECYEEGSGWRVIGWTGLGKRSFFSAIVI